uniref:6,7-dimethyl-8-ribityllumazine synthase n=1 Tax=Glossina austeni TaxID=7395 RepID=A0A1A9UKF6_GLOAU
MEINKLEASHARIAIIIARFNAFINKNLLNGAVSTLKRVGQLEHNNIHTIWVPGAVIKGETFHFEIISRDLNLIISNMSIKNNIPIISSILYLNNVQQGIDRSGAKFGNRGSDAALSLLEMINLLKNI